MIPLVSALDLVRVAVVLIVLRPSPWRVVLIVLRRGRFSSRCRRAYRSSPFAVVARGMIPLVSALVPCCHKEIKEYIPCFL